nr:eukaryotic translation initiation factor 1a [Quercus suber]
MVIVVKSSSKKTGVSLCSVEKLCCVFLWRRIAEKMPLAQELVKNYQRLSGLKPTPFGYFRSNQKQLPEQSLAKPSNRVSSQLAMPKNKGKGGKNRKRGKNEADDEKRELVFKEDGQEYAQVLRMLGNGRCEAMCIDGSKRLCHIRGKMHKKVWIAAGDIILVGLRDYQDDKADVILKYMPDEARLLKAYGELPENTRLNEGIIDDEEEGGGDDYIEFEDEDIDKI